MRVSAVVAASDNGVIGRDGGLPWHVSSDMKLFKEITLGKPVIMGRRTWESLPRRPLPGRRNIVVTRQHDFSAEGAELAHSVEDALAMCAGEAEVSIIGGGQIYADAMAHTDRIYLTRIHLEVDGDTVLPDLADSDWQEVERRPFAKGERDDAAFTLIVLDRV
ncbi:MAG: dihydrofolate reductase [Anderseniella sp.]